ncbi:MAG TPA: AGE family epimerase/isomerase [Phycisphaerae bacterium]|nr:AGE family epimerase/isomerase [Phycisphaerae bacterium]HRR84435.1 AGE family epimerase/isomerase [Phycisphaerae bacterium]
MTPLTDGALAASVRRELLENILPFWRSHSVDAQRGGFVAELSNDLRARPDAAKGLILNARLLWTFSAAYRYTQRAEDRLLARRAYDYLAHHFLDPQHGGYFWELNPDGSVRDGKKKIYGQAFCAYALSECHRTFGEPKALEQAVDVFHRIEEAGHDDRHGGYFETLARDWAPCEDVRLSDKDMNEKKSMNNHLHVLEAYTSLLRARPDAFLADRLRELIDLFERRILNPEKTHLQHFFAEDWTPRSDSYTFGHDIEGSWLLCEAAEALGDEGLLGRVRDVALRMARAVLNEGLDADGGLCYEGRDGRIIDSNREWWPQAEAVVGFFNAWQISGENMFRDAAVRCWQFILNRIVDHAHGEWFWRVSRDGVPDVSMPKVSMWKCPYHNGRCCLEILRRLETGAT